MEKDTNTRRSTITINGTRYDARGQQVGKTTPARTVRHYGSFDITPAAKVHVGPARSQTLKRTGLAKPQPASNVVSRHTRVIAPGVALHPSVSRYGRPSEVHRVTPSDVLSTINPQDERPPAGFAAQVQNYTKAADLSLPRKKEAPSSKQAYNDRALAHAPTHHQKHATATVDARWHRIQKRMRLKPGLIVVGSVILVLIIGVVCYLTVPALSLFVAAKSADVDATYPNYTPAGYHFKGPITYRDGEVDTKFVQNGADASYTILQRKSYWDSEAVLDNYVLPRSSSYLTYNQGGITIYTFGTHAAWINSGVLHAIDGDAPLTSDQILRIAGSM